MRVVSEEYKNKIKAQTRKIYSKVQIDYSDPEIEQGVETITNGDNHTSYPFQVFNGREEPSFKYLSLDGSFQLGDDSFGLAPSEKETSKYSYGLWGNKLSDSNGMFAVPYPKIIMDFIAKPIRSLKLIGDSKRDEYARGFTINLYKEDVLAYTETVVNNDQINWNKEIPQANEITRMEIEISKWSTANRVIKIMEVFTSIQEIYEGDDIFFIHLLEEKEVSQGSLPVGNISSNEIQIKLNNGDRSFDAGNKNSDLYGLVKPNRIIRAWIGIDGEFIPLGVFWSKDWVVPESDIVATVIARDRLDRLRDNTYSTSIVQTNKNMYELAETVLIDAGLNDEQYWIDEELKQFTVPYAYFNPVTHREALRQISTACLGQVYCNRDGMIRIEGPSYVLNKIVPPITEAYEISDDDYFIKDNPSRQTEIANHITIETRPLKPDTLQEVYLSNEPLNITAEQYRDVTIFFNEAPCIDVNISIQGVGTIVNSSIYAWGANIKIYSSTTGTFTLSAMGKPLRVISKDKIVVQDGDSIIDNGIIRYNFPSNHLIQNQSTAQIIADKLLQYYKDPKRDLEMDWRGNPALELNDIVVVNDYVRGDDEELGYYYATKQELEYNGGLRAKLSGRRAI